MPLTLTTGNTGQLDYDEFLRDKVAFDRRFGFEVADDELSPILLPHQRAIVKWAVAGGRRAIFARYGLGKSIMQLEILRLILERQGGRGLIVAPLGVRGDIIRDGRNLLDLEVRFIRRTEEIDAEWSGIYVTNYESVRDGRLDVDEFTAVSLDEAAVLRSFGSKTYQEFLQLFDSVPFRFVATAINLCSEWAQEESWHLCLTNLRPLRTPIPFKGALGLRRLDTTTIDLIQKELS